MNQKIFEHVKKYCESRGWTPTEDNIIETIRDSKKVWQSEGDVHRWFMSCTRVVEIDGMYIGFSHAIVTGDTCAEDMGIEFDKESICEYVSKEKVVIVYEPKREDSPQH